jgi:hypothetical protein
MLNLFPSTGIEEAVINYYELKNCGGKTHPVLVGR